VQTFIDIFGLIAASVGEFARQPELLLIGALVLWLVYRQYIRMAMIEARLIGVVRTHPREHTLTSLGAGAIGGVFATALFVFLGLPLNGISLIYLWLLAILLMAIHPRFICFSYAGGIISLASLTGYIADVNVPVVIALVAALHLIESVLIFLTGAEGAIPVYAKAPTKNIVGGFLMQRYWPIPFLALVATAFSSNAFEAVAQFPTPDWWPLFGSSPTFSAGQVVIYYALPVMAALSYSDFTMTRTPQRKAQVTAGTLFIYSVTLLALAYMAQYSLFWAWSAALGAPLGHELVIWLGRRIELQGKPAYVKERGVMVLSVLPGLPGHKMGLRTGDIIRKVNGTSVNTRAEFVSAIAPWLINVEFEVEGSESGQVRMVSYKGRIPPLGIQFVPEQTDGYVIDPLIKPVGIIVQLWRRWMKRRRGVKHE
jgi:hypothetical protein